jgi:hypothetical protein
MPIKNGFVKKIKQRMLYKNFLSIRNNIIKYKKNIRYIEKERSQTTITEWTLFGL